MVGKSEPGRLDCLIDEVLSGRRDLGSVRDERIRDAISLAMRIHRESSDSLDAYARLRIRARVLRDLRPKAPTFADHAWTVLELLARPAPFLARGAALAAMLVAVGLGATVASADTLPDDLLYPVKIASEGVRLALAGAPADRAEVELSIAEHRLGEAERLASSGRTSDALVAAAVYSQHIAWAAAELAPYADGSDLSQQLEQRFALQRQRVQTLSVALGDDEKSAPAARILSTIARPAVATGPTGAQRVANTAAVVAAMLVQAAEQGAGESETVTFGTGALAAPAVESPVTGSTTAAEPTDGASDRGTLAPAGLTRATLPRTSASRDQEGDRESDATDAGERGSERASNEDTRVSARSAAKDRRGGEVLKAVRKALEEAKAAADRAKKHR